MTGDDLLSPDFSILRITTLDNVEPESVDWLWDKRIPLGKLTMLVGDPGGGKSFVSLAIASAVTRGRRLPDDFEEPPAPARVLMLNFEDGLADTIRPRAELTGCDLALLAVIEGVIECDRPTTFGAHHIPVLDAQLEQMPDVRLVVIDPIAQMLGDVNTSKDNEVRTALQPLKEMAERRHIAVVCVVHLRKADAERTMYRVSGSIAFVGFARSVLLVAKEDDGGRRSISRIKGNLSKDPEPVEFVIDDEGFGWRGVAPDLSAEAMLAAGGKKPRSNKVVDFLRAELADGPRLAREIFALGEEQQFSADQIKRAKAVIGIVATKESRRNGGWFWELPSPKTPRPSHPLHPSESAAKGAPHPSKESSICLVGSEASEGSTPTEERTLHSRENNGARPLFETIPPESGAPAVEVAL